MQLRDLETTVSEKTNIRGDEKHHAAESSRVETNAENRRAVRCTWHRRLFYFGLVALCCATIALSLSIAMYMCRLACIGHTQSNHFQHPLRPDSQFRSRPRRAREPAADRSDFDFEGSSGSSLTM
jgi:hypothetical protein